MNHPINQSINQLNSETIKLSNRSISDLCISNISTSIISHTVLWPGCKAGCTSASAHISDTALASTPGDLTRPLYPSDSHLPSLCTTLADASPAHKKVVHPIRRGCSAYSATGNPANAPTLRRAAAAHACIQMMTSYHGRYQMPPAARGREDTYTKTSTQSPTRLPRPHPVTIKMDPREHASSPFRPATDPLLSSKTEPRRSQPDPTLSNRVENFPETKPHHHGAKCIHRSNVLLCSQILRPPVLKRTTKHLVPATAHAPRVPTDGTMIRKGHAPRYRLTCTRLGPGLCVRASGPL